MRKAYDRTVDAIHEMRRLEQDVAIAQRLILGDLLKRRDIGGRVDRRELCVRGEAIGGGAQVRRHRGFEAFEWFDRLRVDRRARAIHDPGEITRVKPAGA